MNKKLIILLFILGLFPIYFDTIFAQEHIWLHVDGRYMRTSPSANPPDAKFTAVGVSFTNDGSSPYICTMSTSYILNVKSQGVNFIRFPFYFVARTNWSPAPQPIDMNRIFNETIQPAVSRCKLNQMYIILDDHEYFHNPSDPDSSNPRFLPAADPWSNQQFQNWRNYWVQIATKYKDEPWVMGYELQNEAYVLYNTEHPSGDMTTAFIKDQFIQCIQAIRAVDKKHIIFVGNEFFCKTQSLDKTWGPVYFKPDEPYNQLVFTIHEYQGSGTNEGMWGYLRAGPNVDYAREKFRAALQVTECAPVEGPTRETKVEYWRTVLNLFKYRNLGWNNWLQVSDADTYDYPLIWNPIAQSMRSAIPQPGTPPGPANRVVCSVDNTSILSGGCTTFVEARVVDSNNVTIMSTYTFTFNITGQGVLVDSNTTSSAKDVTTYFGMSALRVWSTNNPGTINISVTASGVGSDSTQIIVSTASFTREFYTDWQPPLTTRLRDLQANMPVNKSTTTTIFGVDLTNAKSAMLELTAFDVDSIDEMDIYINNNGPIKPPSGIVGNDEYKKAFVSIDTLTYLVSGNNSIKFVYKGGETPQYFSNALDGNIEGYVGFNVESIKLIVNCGGDEKPPIISNVTSANTTTYSEVYVTWDTNEPGTSRIEYGLTTALGSNVSDDTYGVGHCLLLKNLTGLTTYFYLVKSWDIAGNMAVYSTTKTFVTGVPPDMIPPVISNIKLRYITDTSAIVFWTTNEKSDGQIEFGTTTLCGDFTGSSPVQQWTNKGITLTGLNPGTEYYFKIRANDQSGNLAILSTATFATTLNGSPIGINFNPSTLNLGNIVKGEVKRINLSISNAGAGNIFGSIALNGSLNGSWATISTGSFTGDTDVEITINSNSLEDKREYTSEVVIDTNKGTKRIPLSFILTSFGITNYPNPFTDNTSFLVMLDSDAQVEIRIFTVAGRLIKIIKNDGIFGANTIPWDGKDESGNEISPGVYLYKLISIADGNKTEKTGKLLKIVKKQ